jgi:hypothetical protein
MNTARMDSLLNRQKQHLITDALYALVVVAALVVYVLGLGIGTSPRAASQPAGQGDAAVASVQMAQDTACTSPC